MSCRPTLPLILIAAALMLPVSAAHAQQIVYVNLNASGANNGTSWSAAYTDLQTALLNTSAGQVWVAQGTYYPGPAGNAAATFSLKNNVALYGGFTGVETTLGQRDVVAHVTVLSGDINQDDTLGTALWWGAGWNFNTGNSEHVVTSSANDATAVLDGFWVVHGKADGATLAGGAGLYIAPGTPTIRNCTFRYNAFSHGSSVYVEDASPVFENCHIRDAYTFGARASGVYNHGTSHPTFVNCDFTNHYTVATLGQGGGSAVYIDFNSTATFQGCRFTGNQTGNYFAQGSPSGAYGAGIYNLGDGLVVIDCEFRDNFSHAGSGIYTYGDTTVLNSLFVDNLAISYPITPVVSAGNYGAGIGSVSNAIVTIVNSTFVDNHTEKGGGVACYGTIPATISNSILYHNVSPTPLPGEDPIWIRVSQVVGNYDLLNCCVEGLFLTEPGEDPPISSAYPGCFDEDPQLVNVPGGDVHLAATSPCINSGSDAVVPPNTLTDLEGNPRFAGPVDIGAYEFTGTPLPSLVDTSLVRQNPASWTVFNALPGEAVVFAYSLAGPGPGPCFSPTGPCLGLSLPYAILPVLTADAAGKAHLPVIIPSVAPLIDFHLQAAVFRPGTPSPLLLTNTVSATIYDNP